MKNLKLWAKKILVLTLSTAMTVSAVDIPVVAAAVEMSGSEDVQKEMRITGFAPLEDSIREQVLTIGASEEDIRFPDTLAVTIEQKGSVQEDTQKNSEDQQQGEETEAPEKEQEKEDQGEKEDQTEDQEKEPQEGQTENPEKEQQEGQTENPEKEQQEDQTENPEKEQQEGQTENPEKGQQQEGQTENPEKEQQQEGQTENQEKENAGAEGTALTASVKGSWLEKAADVLFPPMEVYAADWTTEANEDIEEAQQRTEVSVTQEEDTLEGITWKLNIEESDTEVFDSSEQSVGLCYVYTPVLPETDADGNALTVADDVELPQIYVLIEGHKVRTLSNSEVINIADVKPTNSNGQIVINAENVADWNNKILTGSVTSTDLYDSAKGLVIDGVQLNLTIRDLTIDRKEFMRNGISAIELRNQATLNLTLEGDNKLYGAYGGAGIGVPNGTALVITEASSGSLYAKGGNGYGGAAGIGAISPGWNLDSSSSMPQERTCGYIGIEGGNVTAIGGTYSFRGSEICGAAGIGGSYGASLCQINITGGNVTAIGGMYAAGIGGGTDGSVTSIMISGGTVIAEGTGKGMRQPAAIGRGIDSTEKKNYGEPADVLPCGAITLDGGNITAKGNIGYGYVESGEYPIAGPNTKVTVSDEVFLTLDGEIQDGSQSGTVKNYKLNVTVFDTTFTTGQGQMTAKVEHNGSLIQEEISAKVTTPGQATFTLSFAHNTFAGTQTFMVTIDGKSEPYEAKADFKEDQTEYDLTAGKELYPVSLEFYDNAINNREVVVNSISVKQNGKDLKSTDYVQPGKITQVNSGIGKMMIFLPADEQGTTEITVKASGINGSESMTQSKVKVGKTGINTVAMCIGTLTLSARTSKINATDVTLAVESNVMTWDLYIKEGTQKIVKAEDIISDETKHSQTAQKGEVHLTGLKQGKAYTYYMVAKKDDLVSEIVSVSFTTPKGAKVFWENDSSKGELYYENFFSAIYATENINQDGFTILVQGASECYTYLPLEKSCKIDLNGQNVINGNANDSLKLAEGVSAVFTDSAGGAKYHGNNTDGGSNSLFNMASDSSLTIQGGSYYDYKELLKAQTETQTETQTGRTLTIEGGSFYGKNYISIGGSDKVILSGGTFYGGLSVNGSYEIKDGYCVKYLTGENKGTYTTTLPDMGGDIEIVPLPALTGELDLKIGNGGASSVRVGITLTATFTDKDSGDKAYIYTWYSVDGDNNVEVIQKSNGVTDWTTSTYGLKQADIRKRIYCEVTKAGTSGSVKSEMTYPALGYPIDDATITLAKEEFEYDGTEHKPKATVFVSGEQKTESVSYTVSYADNINAGTAKVIITGRGIYDGTAETTFTITKRQGNYKIEGVEDSYEYTGEEIRPAIVVKDDGKVIPESNYTVSYENNKMPGPAKICIKETEDGNYSFGPEDYKEFKIVHEHDWSYDVSGSVIRLECREKVCTCKDNKGTLILSIQNSESLKYNGTTQNVAEVTQYPLGIYPEDKIKLEYTGDGLKDGKPKNAGSYTASMSIEEGGRTYTAKNDFEIQKAEPVIVQKPTAAGITWGETLADSALSGGTVRHDVSGPAISGSFAWKDATRKPNVADSNKTAYTVVFTPDDTVNYKPVETTVMLNIKPAGNTPNFPKDHMEVKYVCRKVKDVQLPDGWEWAAADQETELNVGVQVNATAVYTGEGHGNYETESTVIKITRLACTHTDTKLKDVVAASCGREGYTGDTVCKDCDILLDTGSPTEALTHDYRESGRKAPTSYAEGEIVYTCIHCKDSYSEKIAKLPDGGNNGEASDGDGSSSSGLPAAATATPVPTAGGKTQSPAPAPSSEPVSAPSSKPASTPASSDNNKETKEPFIKGEDGKEGWQVIESQTDGAKEGETIHVDMNGATTVPGAIFDSIRGRDVTVTFDLGGGILWTVNGLDITAQNVKNIDLGVTMGEQAGRNIPVEVINNVTGERYSMNLTLAYEGEFGFTATLTVNMDAANAGLYANLFYYNPETGELEFMCAGKIDEAGNTELTFNHASDYTIVIDTEPMNGVVQDGTGTDQDGIVDESDDTGAAPSGQTADEATDGNSGNVFSNGIFWILIGAAVVIVIAAVGAVCVLRRKKDDPKQSGQK